MTHVLNDALSTCDRAGRKRRRGDFVLGVRVEDIAGGRLGSGGGDEERLRVQKRRCSAPCAVCCLDLTGCRFLFFLVVGRTEYIVCLPLASSGGRGSSRQLFFFFPRFLSVAKKTCSCFLGLGLSRGVLVLAMPCFRERDNARSLSDGLAARASKVTRTVPGLLLPCVASGPRCNARATREP